MSSTIGSGDQGVTKETRIIKKVFVRRRIRKVVRQLNENEQLKENNPTSVSKDDDILEENIEESAEKLMYENPEQQTVPADLHDQSAETRIQEAADTVTTDDLIEASSWKQEDGLKPDVVDELKLEVEKLPVDLAHQIIERQNHNSDLLTELDERVTKIEANQEKLMLDIADIKIMLLALVPQEPEVGVPSSTQQEKRKSSDDNKGEKEVGTDIASEGEQGVVVEEPKQKKMNANYVLPCTPNLLGDAQKNDDLNPIEIVTATGEKKLAYYNTREFLANDEETSRKLLEEEEEEEVLSLQRQDEEEWEIPKHEKKKKLAQEKRAETLRTKKEETAREKWRMKKHIFVEAKRSGKPRW